MRLHGPYYCGKCDGLVTEHTCPHLDTDPDVTTQISGTDMRALLEKGHQPAPHIVREEVICSLQDLPLFVAEDEP